MTNLKLFCLILFIAALLASCEKTIEEPRIETEETIELRSLEIPGDKRFKFTFYASARTSGAEMPEEPVPCAPSAPIDQRGEGKAFKLGNFSVQFTFCGDPSTVPEGFIDYDRARATFIFENGDEIYAEGEGKVIFNAPGSNPSAFFKDYFYFTGAKIDGEMKPASGLMRTNSKVFNILTPDEYTQHVFRGVLEVGE